MVDGIERLRTIIRESDAPERSLVVVNRTEVDPIQRLLETTFTGQSVTVDELESEQFDDDTVLLLEDGEVVTTSPLQAVIDACLLVNSDLYRTGPGGIDRSVAPSVITGLDGTVFELRGFPASVKEKLLLIIISRFIEGLALERGDGVLRATFQELSRMDREHGTLEVYQRLAETDLSVHVYGIDDWQVPSELPVSVHTGDHAGYRDSWCVVFKPADDEARHAAMVALETGANEWLGTWTYERERVRQVERVLLEEF